MLSKSKWLPVLIAVLALALTPVLVSADAGSKDERTVQDAKILEALAEVDLPDEVEDGSHGDLISWVNKSLKDSDSDLMDALKGEFGDDLDDLKHGQIVSAIAKSDAGKNASEDDGGSDDDQDDSNSEDDDDEETGKKNNGKALGKIKNADKHDSDVNSVDDDEDDEDEEEEEEDDEDDDSDASTDKTHGKSELNKNKGQGAKK